MYRAGSGVSHRSGGLPERSANAHALASEQRGEAGRGFGVRQAQPID